MSTPKNFDFLKLDRPPVLVRDLAADTLRKAILTGALKPGERLIEAVLTKRMGISRPSIREALSQLAAEKLVTIVANRGPSVTVITWAEAQDIYHVRSLLEGEAAFLFASRAVKSALVLMSRSLQEFERALKRKDAPQLVASTGEFYALMMEGCGNRIITEMLQGLNARVAVLRARSMSRPGRAKFSLSEMTALLDALKEADAEGARAAAQKHVRAAAAAARESFDDMEIHLQAS
jgi:GntR family transcriptional regulator, trigonelline degradation regulator